jgi:hypothetical protein
MGAAEQALHAVKDADHGFSGDGGARGLVDFGEEREFLGLCLQQLRPFGQRRFAGEISDFGHFLKHRFVIQGGTPKYGHSDAQLRSR